MRFLLFFTLFVFGSICAGARISLGFKGGANLNHVIYTSYPAGFMNGWKPNVGYHAGVFGQIDVAKAFSVIYELQFIQRGAYNSLNQIRVNINYLELPVLIAYSPMKLFQLELGFQLPHALRPDRPIKEKADIIPSLMRNSRPVSLQASGLILLTGSR